MLRSNNAFFSLAVSLFQPTVFLFTKPLLDSIKNESILIYQNFPSAFLVYHIKLLCYSFENNPESFKEYLGSF